MESNLNVLFKTDTNLEKDGVWFKVGDSAEFCLRRFGGANSNKVKIAMAKYHKPHAKRFETNSISDEEANEIMAKVIVEACLIDWKGIVEVSTGEDIPCTPQNAVKLFTSLPELFNTLFKLISEYDSFKVDLGNF